MASKLMAGDWGKLEVNRIVFHLKTDHFRTRNRKGGRKGWTVADQHLFE